MSTSNPQEQVRLEVHTQDPTTEIYIIDGEFNLAGRGVGDLRIDLAPGIYKVKQKAGNEVKEELVTLREGSPPVTRHYKPLVIASPVPLDDTAHTHESHIAASVAQSQAIHHTAGEGSAIYLFVRDWTPPHKRPLQPLHPGRGLSLRRANGELVAEVGGAGVSHIVQKDDPWCAVNIIVDPGHYRLRLDLPSGQTLEQMIYAPVGWQTQVFALQRQYGQAPEERLADISGASILLSRCRGEKDGAWFKGFDQTDRQQRLVELARLALTHQRPVLSTEVRDLLHRKDENPMLGIFGAHLLLMEAQPDLGLLQEVTGYLREMLGPHPDVEALRTVLDEPSYVFETPPMLMASWRLVLKASIKYPALVPARSLAAQVATHLWGPEPWLSWSLPAGWEKTQRARKKPRLTPEQRHLKKVVLSQLNYTEPPGYAQTEPQPARDQTLEAAEESPAEPGTEPKPNLEAHPEVEPGASVEPKRAARPRSRRARQSRSPAPPAPAPGGLRQRLDEETLNRLVVSTGMPRASLEEMVDQLDEADV